MFVLLDNFHNIYIEAEILSAELRLNQKYKNYKLRVTILKENYFIKKRISKLYSSCYNTEININLNLNLNLNVNLNLNLNTRKYLNWTKVSNASNSITRNNVPEQMIT